MHDGSPPIYVEVALDIPHHEKAQENISGQVSENVSLTCCLRTGGVSATRALPSRRRQVAASSASISPCRGMMMIRLLVHAIALIVLLPTCAFALPLEITFTSSPLNADPGQTVTFSATVLNTTVSTVFLNGDSLSINAPLFADDTKFFLNFPISLAGLQSVAAPIFDVTVPPTASSGLYNGHFAILGGGTARDLTTVGSADFVVNVRVPEPASGLLLLLGSVALALQRRMTQTVRKRALSHRG